MVRFIDKQVYTYRILPDCLFILRQDALVRVGAQVFTCMGVLPGLWPWDQILFNGLGDFHIHGSVDLCAIFEIARACQYNPKSDHEPDTL